MFLFKNKLDTQTVLCSLRANSQSKIHVKTSNHDWSGKTSNLTRVTFKTISEVLRESINNQKIMSVFFPGAEKECSSSFFVKQNPLLIDIFFLFSVLRRNHKVHSLGNRFCIDLFVRRTRKFRVTKGHNLVILDPAETRGNECSGGGVRSISLAHFSLFCD